MSFLFKAQDST